MTNWWLEIGQTSVVVGTGLGLIWALISTSRRRAKFIRAATPPVGQARWFALSFFSMGSYATLVTALGVASVQEILPQPLFWFLLGLSALVFMTALSFPAAQAQLPSVSSRETQEEPPAAPPLLPLRRSA